MSTAAANKRRVEVELPGEAFLHHPSDLRQLAREMLTLWFLDQVRQRRISFSKAAELAEIPLARFLELMGEHRITPFDYEDEEIERELR